VSKKAELPPGGEAVSNEYQEYPNIQLCDSNQGTTIFMKLKTCAGLYRLGTVADALQSATANSVIIKGRLYLV
jgi:hypothetical protein